MAVFPDTTELTAAQVTAATAFECSKAGARNEIAASKLLEAAALVSDAGVSLGQLLTLTAGLAVGGAVSGTVQAIAGSGAVNLTTLTTNLTGVGPDAMTLADGTHGQVKIVKMVVHGGDSVLTPTTATGFTTITFDAAGDSVILQFSTTFGWMICSHYGCTVT